MLVSELAPLCRMHSLTLTLTLALSLPPLNRQRLPNKEKKLLLLRSHSSEVKKRHGKSEW